MARFLKVTLVTVAFAVVVGALIVVIGWRGLVRNEVPAAQARSDVHRGRDFGRGKPPAACIERALLELKASPGAAVEERATLFLRGCLAAANADASFCEALPRPDEGAQVAEWTINECHQRNAADIPRCSRVMREVVKHCAR